MGFLPSIRQIVRSLPQKRQTLLFSATLSPEIESLTHEFLKSPKKVQIGRRTNPAETVTQFVYEISKHLKPLLLEYLLRDPAFDSVLVFMRTKHLADRVARRLEAEPLALAEIASALAVADVVVASTNSRNLLVSRDDVEQALATRERRPLLLIDLAVPRDLDPEIATLPYAFLYDVDDLDQAVGTGTVEGAAARAEAIVAEEAERFRAWQASRGVVPAIASLRARAEEIRLGELERAGRRLADLSPEERRAVEAVTVQIVNKLLHDPTVRLKEAAAGADGAAYADAVRHLFGLDPDSDRLEG